MMREVTVKEWKVLRALARTPKNMLRGSSPLLRPDVDAGSKNGARLLALHGKGLILPIKSKKCPKNIKAPEPFSEFCFWRLTELGAHAAEFGEFEEGGH